MTNFLKNLFNNDKKILANIEKQAKEIDALDSQYSHMSDDELKSQTNKLKARLAQGETLDDILVEAFATAREAAYRVIGEKPYLVQLMGGIVLHHGDIAEMRTGEGKTLTAVLPAYLNALSGKGVHVITVNEYLAKRDAGWMGQIHEFLGLSVGVNERIKTASEKREAYLNDILYTTNSEVGFDYLRDNMVTQVENRVQRPLNYALIDEVDSILVDESRTPLIISGGKKQTAKLYQATDKFVKKLVEGEDFEYDEKSNGTRLLEPGVEKAERTFKINNLYDVENNALVHHINQALKANYTMHDDVEYVLKQALKKYFIRLWNPAGATGYALISASCRQALPAAGSSLCRSRKLILAACCCIASNRFRPINSMPI